MFQVLTYHLDQKKPIHPSIILTTVQSGSSAGADSLSMDNKYMKCADKAEN